MKKNNLFRVVMLTILVAVLLSWLLPVTYYSSSLVEGTREPIGIFSIMNYLGIAIQYFSHIGIYVLMIGGLYGVLHKIAGYRSLLDKIVTGFKDHENIFMVIIMVIFAVLSSMAGLSLPLMFLFPFVISVILMMGYDRITAALVTAGSTVIGLIGSIWSINNTYGIDIVLETAADQNKKLKLVLLAVGLILLIFNTIMYAKKHKNIKNKEENDAKASMIPEATGKKGKIWPIVLVMDLVLVVLTLAFFSWDLFGIEFFTDITKDFNSFEIGNFAIFKSLFGIENAFGLWTLVESAVVLVLASFLVSLMSRMSFSNFLENFSNGVKKAVKPAALVILVYVVLVTITYVPTTLTIFKPLLELTKGINVFVMSIVAFVSSIFHVESYYAATGVLPYVTNLYSNLATSDISLLSIIFQAMYGVAMLIAPTSVVLIATLSYLDIPYGKWLKSIWKLFLELFVILIIIFFVVSVI